MIQAVIFDCDGVMFDTVNANTAYYNRILTHFCRPEMTPAQFEFIQMQTVGESIAFLFEDKATIHAAERYRDSVGYEPFFRLMEIEPDLKPLLKRIRPRFRVAIATNRSDTIGRVLAVHGLADDFELVVSALDVDRPKPYPDPLLKVTEQFSIEPHQAIYIGDSRLDEQAARAAGMPLVAYRNRSLTADAHIGRLMEVAALLDSERFSSGSP
jgi:HAD superfamily hydrolase (TIGR01549 family)